MKVLIKSGPEESFPLWAECFKKADPSLDVHFWSDESVDPADVGYVMVWEPPRGWLASLPNLEVVFSSGAGVDHITRDPSWPKDLPLVRMGGSDMAQRMGEFVVWSALSLLRETRDFALGQAAHEWRYKEVEHSAPQMTVGIMGLGNLGIGSARMLSAVGFKIRGWSRTAKEIEGIETFAGAQEFETFLSGTDIVVCLLPATAETKSLLNAQAFSALPRGAGVISVGRGQHVVEDDIIAALDAGHLSGAVVDVFDKEPLATESPLWDHPKVIVTPHIASTPSRQEKADFVASSIRRHRSGQTLSNVFEAGRGY